MTIQNVVDILIIASLFCVMFRANIQSRQIDRIHERIGHTTRMNSLKDPWRDAEDREEASTLTRHQRSSHNQEK